MPTIAFKTRIRTVSENCTLDLVVSHRLVAGEPSAAPRVVKNQPPKGLNILLVSPLTITTTGKLNNRRISAEGLMASRIAQHLLEYLKLNSGELGFEVVSDALIAKDTGLLTCTGFVFPSFLRPFDTILTVFCTASRPSWPLEGQLPHLKLLGFDMDYSWHETPSSSSPECSGLLDSVLSPFSSRLTLPYVTALNNTVERFVKFQMVKRYPRIFGSWIQQFDMEKPFISSIFSSLSNISRRSSNTAFQESCRTQLKMLEKAMFASLTDSENRLSGYLKSPSSLNADKYQHGLPDDDETVFVHAMEQIYSFAMKRREFKSISTSQNWLHTGDDIFCDQQPLLVGFEEELHSGPSDEEDPNEYLSQFGSIADDGGSTMSTSLAEDLFASDLDPLDMQPGIDQFLRNPGSPSDGFRDVEPHVSFLPDISPMLGSLPADPDPDYMSLSVACPENFDIFASKVSTPDLVLSGPGSSAPISSCAEGSRYNLLSESRVERPASTLPSHDHGFSLSQHTSCFKFVTEGKCDRKRADSPLLIYGDTHLQGSLQIMEGANLPMSLSSAQFASGTVGEWNSSFCSGDFVAMEF